MMLTTMIMAMHGSSRPVYTLLLLATSFFIEGTQATPNANVRRATSTTTTQGAHPLFLAPPPDLALKKSLFTSISQRYTDNFPFLQ